MKIIKKITLKSPCMDGTPAKQYFILTDSNNVILHKFILLPIDELKGIANTGFFPCKIFKDKFLAHQVYGIKMSTMKHLITELNIEL